MYNIRQQYNEYKHILPLEILQSELRTSNVVAVLENDSVNPFNIALDRTMLINLSSRSEMETLSKLLSQQQDGITLAKEFLQERLLLSYISTMESRQGIDFKEALKYAVQLCLNFPDGTKRSPAESSLMNNIDYTQVVDNAYANVGGYMVDLMAAIKAVGSFSTVEELIKRVLFIIPRDCGRVDLVADSYREISLKTSTGGIIHNP